MTHPTSTATRSSSARSALHRRTVMIHEGELSIAIPKEVSLKATGTIETTPNDHATPEPQTPIVLAARVPPTLINAIIVSQSVPDRNNLRSLEMFSPINDPQAANISLPCILRRV
ncbi:hypothetical protein PM082_016392 [Marasmius tenuissimus]|nr:hypothetical protein PM082_016392 [Marasmius tenuissimus]